MDRNELNSAWEKVFSRVVENNREDAAQINAFFSLLVPQAMSEPQEMSKGFLMLTADSQFIKNHIERNYIGAIKGALKEMYDTEFIVMMEVDTSQQTPTQFKSHVMEQKPVDESEIQRSIRKETEEAATDSRFAANSNVLSEKTETPESDELDIFIDMSERREKKEGAMTFENFVIGDSNSAAYHMAVDVAENPGTPHLNPLFIYGRPGVGKTHLLRAIQNYIEETSELKTIYVDSAEFLADFIEAGRAQDKDKDSYINFKRKYEDADVLLIDDVQSLANKKQTLDQVFQLFNKAKDAGKQIVFSADRAPRNIDIDERYTSRFNSGGTIDIQAPEMETKLGIMKSFLEESKRRGIFRDVSLSPEIQTYIAESSSSNIRDLKSAITRVLSEMAYKNRTDMTVDEVKDLLENHWGSARKKKITVNDIQRETANYYKVSQGDLVGPTRAANVVHARRVAIYLCRNILGMTQANIGAKFNRDHSTIKYQLNIVNRDISRDHNLAEEIETLTNILKQLE